MNQIKFKIQLPDGKDWFYNYYSGDLQFYSGFGAEYASEIGENWAWLGYDGMFEFNDVFWDNATSYVFNDNGLHFAEFTGIDARNFMTHNNYKSVPREGLYIERHSSADGGTPRGSISSELIIPKLIHDGTMKYVPNDYKFLGIKDNSDFNPITFTYSLNLRDEVSAGEYNWGLEANSNYDKVANVSNFVQFILKLTGPGSHSTTWSVHSYYYKSYFERKSEYKKLWYK